MWAYELCLLLCFSLQSFLSFSACAVVPPESSVFLCVSQRCVADTIASSQQALEPLLFPGLITSTGCIYNNSGATGWGRVGNEESSLPRVHLVASTENLCCQGGEGWWEAGLLADSSLHHTPVSMVRTLGVLTPSPPISGVPSPRMGASSRGHCGVPWIMGQYLALGPFPSPSGSHSTFRQFLWKF